MRHARAMKWQDAESEPGEPPRPRERERDRDRDRDKDKDKDKSSKPPEGGAAPSRSG